MAYIACIVPHRIDGSHTPIKFDIVLQAMDYDTCALFKALRNSSGEYRFQKFHRYFVDIVVIAVLCYSPEKNNHSRNNFCRRLLDSHVESRELAFFLFFSKYLTARAVLRWIILCWTVLFNKRFVLAHHS